MSKVFDFPTIGLGPEEGMAFQSMLVDNLSPGSLIALDSRGFVFGWHPQLEPVFGWTRREMIGKDLSRIMRPVDFEAHKAAMARFLRTGKGPIIGRRIEVTAIHRKGHEFPLELNVSRVDWHGDAYFIARTRDVTERVDFERQLLALTGKKPVDRFEPVRFRSPEDQMALETRQAAFSAVCDAVFAAREIIGAEPPSEARARKVEKILGSQNVPLTISLAVLKGS